MGADQTYVCKDNRENATLKNVRSIDDCSPRGLSLQRKANVANNTGLPDSLKSGVESLSGYSLNDVRVHYNSSKPAAVQAYAYTQGTDIHIAPGQERCLPHEAWHVTQQMSGRVSPTTSIGGVAVNDDASLEHEADVMGARASTLQGNSYAPVSRKAWSGSSVRQNKSLTIQREGAGEGALCEAPNMSVAVEDSAQSLSLKDDIHCIEKFTGKEYVKLHYQTGDFGHFNVTYAPGNRHLDVSLPVRYGDEFEQRNSEQKKRKDFFRDNIKNTWSNKYHINFKRARSRQETPPSGKSWESELNGTAVNVNVVDAKETNQEAFFDLRAPSGRSGVGNGFANLRAGSFEDNSVNDNRELHEKRDANGNVVRDANGNVILVPYPSWNPTAHEAGHMFGLGDEYRVDHSVKNRRGNVVYWHVYRKPEFRAFDEELGRVRDYNLETALSENGGKIRHNYVEYTVVKRFFTSGTPYYYLKTSSGAQVKQALKGTTSAHYDLVKDFFDEGHANDHALMRDGNGTRGDSIMISGATVEPHHYVTFADAMVQAIQTKYPSVPSSEAPNTRGDWKIE